MDTDAVEARKNNRKLQNALKKQRLEREKNERMSTLFRYYAGTSVSLERVAAHMGIDVDDARRGMMNFGREL